MRFLAGTIFLIIVLCITWAGAIAYPADSPLSFHLTFENFDFIKEDFVARSG